MDVVLLDYLSASTRLILLEREAEVCWSLQKKTWISPHLSLDENDQIFDTFGHLGEGSISTSMVDSRKAQSDQSVFKA